MQVGVIGGGIAGLSAASHLFKAGVKSVTLYERDALFAHSSGRNAAIYRPLELEPALTELVGRSAEILDELMLGRASWLSPTGLLLVAKDMRFLEPLVANAERLGIAARALGQPELHAQAPLLRDGESRFGLSVPGAGVLDIHAIALKLAAFFRAKGGTIRLQTDVASIETRNERVTGIVLTNGERIAHDLVVLAGGAWVGELARTYAASVQLSVLRRHLILLEPSTTPVHATIWDVRREFYFRNESRGILASPGDAVSLQAPDYRADTRALHLLFEKARKVAPSLAQAKVRRLWACLRTFAPDRLPVIGADARVSGLFWLAALGGSGMSAGLAAGEVLTRAVQGTSTRSDAAFSPRRFALERQAHDSDHTALPSD